MYIPIAKLTEAVKFFLKDNQRWTEWGAGRLVSSVWAALWKLHSVQVLFPETISETCRAVSSSQILVGFLLGSIPWSSNGGLCFLYTNRRTGRGRSPWLWQECGPWIFQSIEISHDHPPKAASRFHIHHCLTSQHTGCISFKLMGRLSITMSIN